MTKLLYILLFCFPVICTGSTIGEDPIAATGELIKKANIHELAKTFASSVDVTIMDQEDVYSAAQAEIVLEGFFKNNAVKSVTILHRVTSNPNVHFAVFNMVTAKGAYRTSVSLILTNGQFLVNEFRIETKKD